MFTSASATFSMMATILSLLRSSDTFSVSDTSSSPEITVMVALGTASKSSVTSVSTPLF